MSWSRRLLKTNAKKAVGQSYWRYIAVCFLVMLICGSSYTSTQLFQKNMIDELVKFVSKTWDYFTTHESLYKINKVGIYWLFRKYNLIHAAGLSLSVILWSVYKIFISNIVRINSVRFFLESRTYPKTTMKKLGYLYKGKAVNNPAKIMLCMYIKRFLWWFTIVGGVIKTYEYSMIPYILAENPDISLKDAFLLSKQMMQGKKITLFVLHISFLPWFLLGIITMGLSNIFYLNAYFGATNAEFYMMLRHDIVAQRNKYSKFFIDKYLENKPSEDEILINMFVCEKDYMPNLESDEFSQNVYPMFLRGKDSKWYETPYRKIDNRDYHLTTYILLFFFMSVAGWVFNSIVGFMRQGEIMMGGLIYGPCILAVGFASVMIMVIGRVFMKHPLINVSVITVFSSAVHYGYVWLVDLVKGKRYWDFSDYFLNIHGRICLASIVVVGALGTALFYLIGPEINEFLSQYPVRKKWKMCILLSALLILDAGCSIYFLYL